MLSNEEERIIAAEVPPQQELRRGRVFMRVYATLLLVAAAAFVALAVLVSDQSVLPIDVQIARTLQSIHVPIYGWLLTHVSDLGYVPGNVIAYVLVFVVFFALRLRLEAVLAVASSLVAGVVAGAIKLVVERMRPSPQWVHVVAHLGGFSFPSGHVVQYVTLFGFAFYVVLVAWPGSAARTVVLVVLGLLVVLVGPSRVYLGEHWPSDALGAYLFGGLWLAGTIELHLVLKRRLDDRWSARSHRWLRPVTEAPSPSVAARDPSPSPDDEARPPGETASDSSTPAIRDPRPS